MKTVPLVALLSTIASVAAAAPPVTIQNSANTGAVGVTAGALNMGGNVASGTADSGDPVKVGCVFNSTLPTISNLQRSDCQSGPDGSIRTAMVGTGSTVKTGIGTSAAFAYGIGNTSVLPVAVENFDWNGTLIDATFTCPNSAVVNVTAGNTTQIVALSGTTVIRVCSIAVSMSAAGTAGFYTGTGTNCGTGTTALIQDMTLATGTPLQLSAGNGSLIRSSAGGALCVKAVTGNVTGFISYAQY